MAIDTIRDLVIIIAGILYILILIGLVIGLLIGYLKIRALIKKVNKLVDKVRCWAAFISGLAKGIQESVKVFRRGAENEK